MENSLARDSDAVKASAVSVQATVRHLQDELSQLLQERSTVVRRIAGAKRTILGLAELLGEQALDDDLRKLVEMRTGERNARSH